MKIGEMFREGSRARYVTVKVVDSVWEVLKAPEEDDVFTFVGFPKCRTCRKMLNDGERAILYVHIHPSDDDEDLCRIECFPLRVYHVECAPLEVLALVDRN